MSLLARKKIQPTSFGHDLTLVGAGFALAFLFCVALFELFNVQFHWIGGQRTDNFYPAAAIPQDVHGAAPQTPQQTGSSRLIVTLEKDAAPYAVPGQKDVMLLNFSLSPSSDGFVRGMSFVLDDLAHPYDLKSLKLLLGDQPLGEVSFFEGKGVFDNLMIKLAANKLMNFTVTGTLGDQAQAGDRLRLRFSGDGGLNAGDSGLTAGDGDGNAFNVVSGTAAAAEPGDNGPAVSIVNRR